MKTVESNDYAHICVEKGRMRVYQNSLIYLKDEQEFQIELFNPTSEEILAKIKMNGKYISNVGLVLYPGQRIYLDRFLDEAKKFKFVTYEVESDNSSVEEAIKNNGEVVVEFYAKTEKSPTDYSKILDYLNRPRKSIFDDPYSYKYEHYYDSTPVKENFSQPFKITCSAYPTEITLLNNSTNCFSSTVEQKIEPETKETGIIGKGEDSQQKFRNVDINFKTVYFKKEAYKILPISQQGQKIIEKCDCGKKLKKSWKFCSKCGKKK